MPGFQFNLNNQFSYISESQWHLMSTAMGASKDFSATGFTFHLSALCKSAHSDRFQSFVLQTVKRLKWPLAFPSLDNLCLAWSFFASGYVSLCLNIWDEMFAVYILQQAVISFFGIPFVVGLYKCAKKGLSKRLGAC